MALEHARLANMSVDPPTSIEVLFNPTDYGISRGADYAAMPVPGLQSPIYQFIRGESAVLSLELFLDRTNQRLTVESKLQEIRKFVIIDGVLHAPPVCRFDWGDLHFVGIVTSLRERFSLFDEHGGVTRARVALTLKSYTPAAVQLRELKRSSPDRTHLRVLREGETLAHLAAEVYGDPRLWRVIAEANDIDHPRFVPAGTPLKVPST